MEPCVCLSISVAACTKRPNTGKGLCLASDIHLYQRPMVRVLEFNQESHSNTNGMLLICTYSTSQFVLSRVMASRCPVLDLVLSLYVSECGSRQTYLLPWVEYMLLTSSLLAFKEEVILFSSHNSLSSSSMVTRLSNVQQVCAFGFKRLNV